MDIDFAHWASELKSGNTAYLSRTITLLESTQKAKQIVGQRVLQAARKSESKSWRIAVSGVPGVGKSTFVNALGKALISEGKRVAVLAIDPSSSSSKGSILGDKTRMVDLAQSANAYIRPTATSGNLGGIAQQTYEAALCCEAAGFDVILIETVGVGQSETAASEITDLFIYLKIPQTGDDLQGMKRGIMELADILFINKCDVFGKEQRNESLGYLKKSIPFLPEKNPNFKRRLISGSAINGNGIQATVDAVSAYYTTYSSDILLKREAQELQICQKYATNLLVSEFTSFLEKQKKPPTSKSLFDHSRNLVSRFLEKQKLR